jgi:hypothetical protein
LVVKQNRKLEFLRSALKVNCQVAAGCVLKSLDTVLECTATGRERERERERERLLLPL